MGLINFIDWIALTLVLINNHVFNGYKECPVSCPCDQFACLVSGSIEFRLVLIIVSPYVIYLARKADPNLEYCEGIV
jgi:hypothetical protein